MSPDGITLAGGDYQVYRPRSRGGRHDEGLGGAEPLVGVPGTVGGALIMNAGTRELVWKMDRDNTRREKEDRVFDDDVAFKKGSYEVYFAAYAFRANSPFTSFTINIDRRKDSHPIDGVKKRGIFSWFQELMGHHDIEKEFKKRSKEWVIELAVDEHENQQHNPTDQRHQHDQQPPSAAAGVV